MKKQVFVLVIGIGLWGCHRAQAQAQELQQLALNIEKLAQFKQILSDMKKGYQLLTGGYQVISQLSKGNYTLHRAFLEGLLQVSPAVRKYQRVTDIIDCQLRLVQEYRQALRRFRGAGWLTLAELDYINTVYTNLFKLSLDNLDDLLAVITAGSLRMSDDERLAAIDHIHADMEDKLVFLRQFNNSTSVLALQRAREKIEVERLHWYFDQ